MTIREPPAAAATGFFSGLNILYSLFDQSFGIASDLVKTAKAPYAAAMQDYGMSGTTFNPSGDRCLALPFLLLS